MRSLNIITPEVTPEPLAADAPSAEDLRRNEVPQDPGEFEIVLGRRQIAGLSFLGIVLIAVCSSGAYLAGKLVTTRAEAAPKPVLIEPPTPTVNITETAAESVPATPVPATAVAASPVADLKPVVTITPTAASPSDAANPMFAEPIAGAIYIQTGAVEKGMAVMIAEGLRTHGFNAFVAPGPNDKIYRILVGPFGNTQAYQRAREALDQIGLSAFARQYQK